MEKHILELGSNLGPGVFHVARESLKEGDIQEIEMSDFLYMKL